MMEPSIDRAIAVVGMGAILPDGPNCCCGEGRQEPVTISLQIKDRDIDPAG